MKRLFALLVILGMLISILSGCGSKSDTPDAPSAGAADPGPDTPPVSESAEDVDSILLSALDGQLPIRDPNGQFSRLPDYLEGQYQAVTTAYTLVDFDGDGQNEMAVQTDSQDAACLILRYADETVHLYLFQAGLIQVVKADGSVIGSSDSQTVYATLEFPNNSCLVVYHAKGDYDAGSYTIDGAGCSAQDFAALEKDWALKPNAAWVNLYNEPVAPPQAETTEPETEAPEETVTEETVMPDSNVNYLVTISRMDQPIYSGPGYHNDFVGTVGIAGTYTIVQELWDENNHLWGKLKSGVGWVDLTDVVRYENPIVIQYADSDLLASGNFHNCDTDASAHASAVAIFAQDTLLNVQIFYNHYTSGGWETTTELYFLQKFTPEKPIVAAISFTDTSTYCISFEDIYGNFYLYEFYMSGMDGSLDYYEK